MAQEISQEKFLQIYGNLLINTWALPDLKERFKTHPSEVLKEFGLDPGRAKVNILPPWTEAGPECTPESQYRLWQDGLKSGSIDFIYPEEPPEGAASMELTEEQLAAVAGGGYYCCCCTPCCSCS